MLGEAWITFAGGVLLASVLLRNGLLFVLAIALLLTAAVSRFWERHCLDSIEYHRRFSQTRAMFGEEVELALEITNRKALPLTWLEIEDEIPASLAPLRARLSPSHKAGRALLLSLLSLRWYERVRYRYRLHCQTRGEHVFGPAVLRSGDLFGFRQRQTTLNKVDSLLVYPRVVPLTRLGLPAKDPFGDRRSRQWLFPDMLRIAGARDYVPGDNPRHIDWKATARAQRLQVRVFEPTTTYQLVIFNLNTYGGHWWWMGYDPDLLELAISTAASVAAWAVENDYQVGLCANGSARLSDAKFKVAPSRDPEQLTRILEALAKALPFATMPLEALLQLERRDLPYGATLVVVTAVLNDEIAAELQALKAAGHRLALLLIGSNAPDVRYRGMTVYRIGGENAWRDISQLAADANDVPGVT